VRVSCNKGVNRIRHIFKHAVANELIEPTVLHKLQAVPPLLAGRTLAHVYVLQGHKVPEEQPATLGERFEKLSNGWKYRVQVLEKDLVMKLTPKAPIPSVHDEYDQIYIRIPE
jgi:hypothetical protein